MNWKSFLLGIGVGVAGGLITRELLEQKSVVSPEKALASAKEVFRKNGDISGSWIHMKVEPFEKGNLQYKVYRGGISRQTADATEQFEFVADAGTGTILDAYPL